MTLPFYIPGAQSADYTVPRHSFFQSVSTLTLTPRGTKSRWGKTIVVPEPVTIIGPKVNGKFTIRARRKENTVRDVDLGHYDPVVSFYEV